MSDIVERTRRMLEGTTPGPWHARKCRWCDDGRGCFISRSPDADEYSGSTIVHDGARDVGIPCRIVPGVKR